MEIYIKNSLIFFSTSFLWVLLTGKFFIHFLKKNDIGQRIRKDGPSSHLKKKGIPTMGGILIIVGIILPLLITKIWNYQIFIFTLVVVSTVLLGLSDDLIKVTKKRAQGLKARQKMFFQVLIAIILAILIYNFLPEARMLFIPFFKTKVDLDIYIIPIIILTFLATVNSVNLTDGLDGLAASITTVVAITLFVFITIINRDFTTAYLSISTAGACLGFLWYNSKPASVFMGDLGSLSLGAVITVLFSFEGLEILLIFVGGIFVIEALSVIFQVVYFKYFKGKRLFLMAPIHHHYELKGYSEAKIVYRFTLLSILFSIFSIMISI